MLWGDTMRPVSNQFRVTQGFASLATGGVVGNPNGTMVQILVSMYGDYQHDGHAGADIGCPVGTPVHAARSGTVVLCDWDVNLPGDDSWSASGYFQRFAFYKRFGGRLLVIKVAPNDYDVYAHLSAWKVGYGQQVSEGQLVALSGDSSAGLDGQLGPHLHTERIVDLTYSTGNGLIFGRMDPTSVWGGIAAMAGTITELQQEEPLKLDQEDLNAVSVIVRDWGTHAAKEALQAPIIDWGDYKMSVAQQTAENAKGLQALTGIVRELAAGQGIDQAKVDAAIKQALAGVSATITIGEKPNG